MSIFPVDAALGKELPLFDRQVLISSEIVGSGPIVPQHQGQDSKNTGGVLEAHCPLQGGVDFGIRSAGIWCVSLYRKGNYYLGNGVGIGLYSQFLGNGVRIGFYSQFQVFSKALTPGPAHPGEPCPAHLLNCQRHGTLPTFALVQAGQLHDLHHIDENPGKLQEAEAWIS